MTAQYLLPRLSLGVLVACLFFIMPMETRAMDASDFGFPNLGERLDSPYKPYTFRDPAFYHGPEDYDGVPIWDPEWLERKARQFTDYRKPATFMPGTTFYDPSCPCWRVAGYDRQLYTTRGPQGSTFYQKAMSRSSDAFADPGYRTYNNYQYRFENQLRSIR